jgi:hypothetical protein
VSIEQKDKIDLINWNEKDKELVLTITDHLTWDGDQKNHIWLLQEKINQYLNYIENGDLDERFIQLSDNKITIRVVGLHKPFGLAVEFYNSAASKLFAASVNLKFVLFGNT